MSDEQKTKTPQSAPTDLQYVTLPPEVRFALARQAAFLVEGVASGRIQALGVIFVSDAGHGMAEISIGYEGSQHPSTLHAVKHAALKMVENIEAQVPELVGSTWPPSSQTRAN